MLLYIIQSIAGESACLDDSGVSVFLSFSQ